ncbi:MAG: maleylacetate reductase [Burkholderiales bacterium]
MIAPFAHAGSPARIVFGAGRMQDVAAELARLAALRALVVCTASQRPVAEMIAVALGDQCAALFPEAAMHTPVTVTERALALARTHECDAVVAVGGGSAIGLAKALALRTDWPQVVLPTTYAGSEATPILGETSDGRKVTQRSPRVLPEVVIYDVELTLSLPPAVAAASGMNAIAHAVEALYAKDANPLVSMMAEEGIAALARSLPRIVADPHDRDARSDAQYGAWLCGTCLGAVGMALHHKLCHVLGGTFDLDHARTHAVMLPHAAAYNAAAAPAAMARVARALGADDAIDGLTALARTLGVPRSLREIGMPADGLDRAADLALRDAYWNPRPLAREPLRALLQDAFTGAAPNANQGG